MKQRTDHILQVLQTVLLRLRLVLVLDVLHQALLLIVRHQSGWIQMKKSPANINKYES